MLWKQLTFDPQILEWVKGVKLDFIEEPMQINIPKELNFTGGENHNVKVAIQEFLAKGIIAKANHEPREFISQIFPRTKKSGKTRIILHLSKLNCD
jgi:hypothetical protein